MNPSFQGPIHVGGLPDAAARAVAGFVLTTAGRLAVLLCLAASAASLSAANTPPTIGTISNYTVFIDQPTLPVDLVIADAETPKTNLLLSAVSSDQTVVPDGNIYFGALGNSRYLTVTPAFGATGSVTITVTVSDATNSISTNFNFTVLAPPAGSARFANTNAITIPNSGVASIYPSTIEVTGLTGAVVNVALTLSALEHQFPEDMRMLLIGPGGQGAIFFAHVGGGRAISNVTLTITDSSPFPLPDETLLVSEPLRPANYGTNNTLPAPAPGGPFGTNLATFNGSAPSGTWSLYIVDDITPDHGLLAGGWSLLIAAAEGPLPPTISDITNRVTTSGVPTPVIPFTIGDPDTAASNLVVSGYASNPILVPTNAIVFGGSGSNRTVRVTPAVGQSGLTTITVTVSDGTNSASDSFDLTVNPANTPPVISAVADQTINEDTVLGPIAFTVTDAELAAGSLVVSGGASNPGLVPTNSFLFGGSGSNRTVTLAPAANSNGTTVITLIVSDGTLFTTTNFTLTVNAVNDRPTISDIPNRLTTTNFPTPALPFVVTDVDTPVDSLVLTADSSNPALVPTNSIVFGGSGANRTVTVTPVGGLTGTSTITVTVSDGALSTNDTFVLTVITSNSPPVISSIADQTIDEDTNTGPIAFTIGDAQTGAGSLVLSRGSSNPALVPTNNIIISGGASNRTVTVTPLANQNGTAIITVGVDDGQYLVTTNFLLTVNPVDDRPTISAITNRVISVNSTAGPIAFVIGDLETAASNLTVTASSSDQTLLPDANITLGGADSNRTVTLIPAANEVGVATITINVSDGELSTNRSFILTVTPPNTVPTIGTIPNQTVYVDQPTLALALPINDTETPRVNLVMTGTSSDTNLVPNQNIFFGTFAPNQYFTVTPAMGQLGTATITVNVSDGTNTTSTNFLFTVIPPPPGAARFANETPITIPNVGIASPYSSDINVAGMSGTITNLELTLSQINHEFVTDLEMLLVSPSGQGVVVFSHVAQGHSASNVTVTLSDRSPFTLPQSFFLWSEPLKPTDWGSTNQFPAPAPAGPYGAVAMATFNGLTANGTWSLYVYDDFAPDHGAISGGWSLMISTTGGSGGAPFISNITNQTTLVNTPTAAIPFTIGDNATPASNLVLTASSSNPGLMPTNNIVFGGSESNRTVTLTPTSNTLGSATITVSVSDGSFTSLDTFVLTVIPAPLTINVAHTNRSYGETNPVFTGSLIGQQPGDGITATFSSAATTNSAVGTYTIVPSLSDPNGRLANYLITTNQGTLTVTAAPLTVTAANTNRVYGATNPVFTGALAGLRNNDNITATFTSAATTNSPVGNYPILVSLSDPGSRLANYTVTTNGGTLAVTAAGLTITVDSTNRAYGAANPTFTGALTGLRNNDDITATFTSAATTNSPVGGYPILVSLSDPGSRLTNYTVTTNGGTLAVTAAGLTITVDSTNRAYGAANPTFTGALGGLRNNDNITATFTSTATTNSPVGNYPILVSLSDPGSRLANYNVTTNGGTLAVTAAGLTITVDSTNRAYGAANPTFTGALTGLRNNDDITATFASAATTNSAVGGYPILVSLSDPGSRLANYNVTTNGGTLAVTAAGLTITVDSTNRAYGAANPTFTGALTGLRNNDDITATFTSAATTNSPVGNYPILVSLSDPGSRLANYNVTTNGGTLAVTAAGLTITVDSTNRAYGAANPTFTGALTGLRNNDDITATFASAATTNSAVGGYPILVSLSDPGSRLANYNVTTNGGTLAVTAAGLTITVDSTNRAYGAANPTFTGALTGLRNNDDITATFTSTATTNSPVGGYPILVSLSDPGSRLTNYTVTTNGGTLSVTAAGSTNSLVSSLNPSTAGSNVTFTATVTRLGSGAGQPAGSVQFLTNGGAAGLAVPLTGAVASLSLTNLPAGTNQVLAIYGGDGNFLGSTSSLFQVVTASQPADPPIVLGIFNNGDGTVTLRFGGSPGAQYTVETTTNLLLPIVWTIRSTNTAGTNGQWAITNSLTTPTQQFYRSSLP